MKTVLFFTRQKNRTFKSNQNHEEILRFHPITKGKKTTAMIQILNFARTFVIIALQEEQNLSLRCVKTFKHSLWIFNSTSYSNSILNVVYCEFINIKDVLVCSLTKTSYEICLFVHGFSRFLKWNVYL